MKEAPTPSGRTEKRVLLVSAVILLLAFFSTSFTGYYNVGKSGGGIIDCHAYYQVKAYIDSGEIHKRLNYDREGNNNGELDEGDLEIIAEKAENVPCTLPPECIDEGETRCAENNKVVNLCVRDRFSRLVLEEVSCDKGQRCEMKGDKRGFREAVCEYPFRNA